MAKAPKIFCAHCQAKMPPGVSFCPSCAHPTIWCSYDDRIQWEMLQYRRMRENSGSPPRVAMTGARVSGDRSYRRHSVVKQPVTVKIEKQFGEDAAPDAAGVAAVGQRSGVLQIERPSLIAPAPTLGEGPPPVMATPELSEPSPTGNGGPREPSAVATEPAPAVPTEPSSSDTLAPIAVPEVTTTKPPERVRPRAEGDDVDPNAPKEFHPTVRHPKPVKPTLPANPFMPIQDRSATLPLEVQHKLDSVDVLADRLGRLEARVTELTESLDNRKNTRGRWRRFLGD